MGSTGTLVRAIIAGVFVLCACITIIVSIVDEIFNGE